MWLDMSFTIIGQAHEARLNSLFAMADTEIAERFSLHVGERSELRELALCLLVHVGQISFKLRPWCIGGVTLWAPVHTHVVKLVPVNRDALQAVGVSTGDGDRVS